MAYTIDDVYKLCDEIGLRCLSSEYKSIKSNLKFICTECGEEFERNFDNLKTRKSTICNKCGKSKSNSNRVFTYEFVKNEIEGSGCKLISENYINTDSKLKIMCSCGREFETTFYKFKHKDKKQCNECGKKILANKISIPESEIKKIVEKDGYKLLDRKLNGKDQRIYLQCNKNHKPYWTNISKYKSTGRRCPHCQNSKGEREIENIFKEKGIDFKAQYKFDDLVGIGGGKLRFDFAIFDNKELKFLVEYDGEMHYENTGVGNDLERQKIHDKMKDEYCFKKNIKLVRIPYWEFDNIERIINNV